jgi:hypothetical protein
MKLNLIWVLPEVLAIASNVQIKVGLTLDLLSVSSIRTTLVMASVREEVFFRPVAFGLLCYDTQTRRRQ